jgi:hypothetical protein
MCHRVYITLSVEERKEVRKLSGIMVPIYASVLMGMIAVVAISGGGSRPGEQVAATAAPAATH